MDYSKPVDVTPPAQVPDHTDNYQPAGCVLSLGSTAKKKVRERAESNAYTPK